MCGFTAWQSNEVLLEDAILVVLHQEVVIVENKLEEGLGVLLFNLKEIALYLLYELGISTRL